MLSRGDAACDIVPFVPKPSEWAGEEEGGEAEGEWDTSIGCSNQKANVRCIEDNLTWAGGDSLPFNLAI